MPLTPGQRIGPYEVTGALGVGGMGEVFRARDTRLKRDVALKVLPASALQDHDRRARFEREAQVLASLNHTSIAQVFGVELDGDAMVIVMELVEGDTLADRMAKGIVPIDDALAIACEICDGLEAAHDRGIVHRDLKPANIKIRPDGTIKILDFGIARVLTDERQADAANSPTMLSPRTDSGFILGTAAYMSPEQARGRGVDKRADIWAFGCVLYEMLTGARVFPGDSVADILAAILSKEPDWSKLPSSVSPRIRELLRRCLEKNPKDRLRDAGDARYEIQHAGASVAGAPGATSKPRANWSRIILLGFASGALIGAGAVILLSPLFTAKAPAAAGPIRSVIQLPPNTALALSRGSVVAISPDGKALVFAGKIDGKILLFLRPLDKFESTPIAGTDGAANPFFSPDGRWVGFFADQKLKKVSLDGGAPVVVADVPNARGETWAGDDTIYVTPNNNALVSRVPALGGALQVISAKQKSQLSHRWPFALPDGAGLIFTVWNDLGWEPARTVAQKIGSTEQKLLVDGGGYAHYIRDAGHHGFLVYARAEGLLAAPLDESTLAVTGPPAPLGETVITNLSGGAHFDLSASGSLAYVPGAIGEADRDLTWVSLDGKTQPAMRVHGLSRLWSLSGDGRRIVRNNTVGATRDIWVDDLTLGSSVQLMSATQGYAGSAVWLPGDKSIIFTRDLPGNLYRRSVDGGATAERLTVSDVQQIPSGVSPDGQTVAFTTFDATTGSDIWMLSLADKSTRPFVKTPSIEGSAVFSPDGRWVAYQSNDSGRFEIFVRSFPDGQQIFRVSSDGGIYPAWAPDGHGLFFRSVTSTKMMVAPVTPGPAFHAATARPLFDGGGYENTFAVAPDGKRLLMMPLIPFEQFATQINLVQNFISELRARVK